MICFEVTLFFELGDSCPCEKRGIPNRSRSGFVARNRMLELRRARWGAIGSAVSARLCAQEERCCVVQGLTSGVGRGLQGGIFRRATPWENFRSKAQPTRTGSPIRFKACYTCTAIPRPFHPQVRTGRTVYKRPTRPSGLSRDLPHI